MNWFEKLMPSRIRTEPNSKRAVPEGIWAKCPGCGALKLRRLIGAGAGVIFRGSGFYQTDYRSESYRKAADKESSKDKPAKDSGKKDAASDKGAAKKEPAD